MKIDFLIDNEGELVMNDDAPGEISSAISDTLRLQHSYNRIKSVSENWFIDKIGANLETLIGRECSVDNAEIGKQLILNSLTKDGLWKEEELLITASIVSNTTMEFDVIFKIYQGYSEETVTIKEIVATLDLVKGVHIRYGWEPRR